MKTVIIKRNAYGRGKHQFNPLFEDFAKHCGFALKVCRPYRAQTKGKVERFNHYLRYSFHNALRVKLAMKNYKIDIDNANAEVLKWLENVANVRIHQTTLQRPFDLLAEEQPHLLSLPKPYGGIHPKVVIQSVAKKQSQFNRDNLNVDSLYIPNRDIQTYDDLIPAAVFLALLPAFTTQMQMGGCTMALDTKILSLCKSLKLSTIAEEFHTIATTAAKEEWQYAQFLQELLQQEYNNRMDRSKSTLTKLAGFPAIKTLEQFDYTFSVGVNRKQIEELSTLSFIKRNENIILLGQCGVGKTHLAIALAYKAVQHRYKAKFTTIAELLHSATKAKKERKYDAFLKSVTNPFVLVIDEIGYFNMNKEEANHFFQIISKRYEKGSTIITSNLVFSKWTQIFAGDKVVTTAILDRLLHHSHIINIQGDSYRLKEKKEQGILNSDIYKIQAKSLDQSKQKTEVV